MENNLEDLARLVRYHILTSTTAAGSGHPTSSLSAADIMTGLCFGGYYRFDLDKPENPNNDRLIFSKGHASPLFYSLYAAAGKISAEEMLTLRKFGSRLEGHPTTEFPYTEVPTGSLGQGLSVGVGEALNAKMGKLSYRTYVLLGDSELAEGSVWEAMQLASHYQLDNLVAILDVNRLGQRGETMLGWDTGTYQKRAEAFGWEAEVIDGHNFTEIKSALDKAVESKKPFMIIARTVKGKGVAFIEDKDNWHGKALNAEELHNVLAELGEVKKDLAGVVAQPEKAEAPDLDFKFPKVFPVTDYPKDKAVATRKAYGNALVKLAEAHPGLVVLDAETSNSTYSADIRKTHAEKFVECFIAEQNMAGMALGFSRRGRLPFVSTFAAFLSRAFDQIRMAQYADANIKFCGSHAGVSIGEDGASQMGLEEIAMFRSISGSVVLYPSDAVSTEKLVWESAKHKGNVYIQTTRKETAVIYGPDEEFPIGGSKTLKSSEADQVTVIGAGVTLHEALGAYEELKKENISIRVIDLYSIKPLDLDALKKAAEETKTIITVEDNHHEGGLAEAVLYGLNELLGIQVKFKALAVKKMPHSGKPDELMAYEEINSKAIIKAVRSVLS